MPDMSQHACFVFVAIDFCDHPNAEQIDLLDRIQRRSLELAPAGSASSAVAITPCVHQKFHRRQLEIE